MDVITLAARKGGVGKTMLAASLAVLAHMRCGPDEPAVAAAPPGPLVGIIDLDPQGSLSAWHNMRTDGSALFRAPPGQLAECIDDLRRAGLRHLFIGTPPGYTDIGFSAMRLASVTLIPVRPGELDLAATVRTVAAAERAGLRYAIVPNGGNFRSRGMGETIRLLRDAGLELLPAIHNRVGLALSRGRTETEAEPLSRGAEELEAVWERVERMVPGGSSRG